MKTERDLEDLILEAREDVNKMHDDFTAEWYKPVLEQLFSVEWQNLPPDVKARLSQTLDPGVIAELEKTYGQKAKV